MATWGFKRLRQELPTPFKSGPRTGTVSPVPHGTGLGGDKPAQIYGMIYRPYPLMETVSKNLWFCLVCCTFMLQITKRANICDDLLIYMLHTTEVVHIRKCYNFYDYLYHCHVGEAQWAPGLRNISLSFSNPYFWTTQMTRGKARRNLEAGFINNN